MTEPLAAGSAGYSRKPFQPQSFPQLTLGYNLARMRHKILLSPQALDNIERLPAHVRASAKAGIKEPLRFEPKNISKSRIKGLRGTSHPEYRLRLGDVRVFHDVAAVRIEVLTVVLKVDADAWLKKESELE